MDGLKMKTQKAPLRRTRAGGTFLTLGLLGLSLLASAWAPAAAATFTVTTNADPGNGTCTTAGTGDGCTLREAITAANATGGDDTIEFAIGTGAQTISPASALPDITQPVIIDGTTQPGFSGTPLIEIDGSAAGTTDVNGLTITGQYSAVFGLVINNFSGHGIALDGSLGCTVSGNYIGIDADGSTPAANTGYGVAVLNGVSCLIGGKTAGERNVISGNTAGGVLLFGADGGLNGVGGNYIGTNAAGNSSVGNGGAGVDIFDSPFNGIGGETADDRNVIAGNLGSGVSIFGVESFLNSIQNNYIGTDAGGTTDLGNAQHGVEVLGAGGNLIGGILEGDGIPLSNVISGNNQDGVSIIGSFGEDAQDNHIESNTIGLNAGGDTLLANGDDGVSIIDASFNSVGGTAEGMGNVISGNVDDGIEVSGSLATDNVIRGNIIGLLADGTTNLDANAVPAGNNFGVYLLYGNGNTVGGTEEGARNVISGNKLDGILIYGSGDHTIQGNYIGTDAAGTADVGNNGAGLDIEASNDNRIGGTSEGAGNVISGNSQAGLYMESGRNNVIQGNFIGTDLTGIEALGNSDAGIYLDSGSPNNTVGGTEAGAGNVVAANGSDGIYIDDSGNTVQGNLIGVDVTGTQTTDSDGDALGNDDDGIDVEFGNNLIGGTAPSAGNVISGNFDDGIYINYPGNTVQGNKVGVDITGTQTTDDEGNALGNGSYGIEVNDQFNIIGGTQPGAGNVISGNDDDGIYLDYSSNVVRGNKIGVDITGTQTTDDQGNLLGNNGYGIYVNDESNTVGGTDPGAGNVVSGNLEIGIYINYPNTIVQGNKIGVDITGTQTTDDEGNALGNDGYGIYVNDETNLIGGTQPGAGNVVSGNSDDGIYVNDDGNVVQGNKIGTDITGTKVVDNYDDGNANTGPDGRSLGNDGDGVYVNDDNCLIGGTTQGAGNVISGNFARGVYLASSYTRNKVQGNKIGVKATATAALSNGLLDALGNTGDGVYVAGSNNLIGDVTRGAGNIIAFNGGDGVGVGTTTGINNTIRGNAIHQNGDLGIDLGSNGPTPNDNLDPDAGPNNLQNFPVVSVNGITASGASTAVTLNSRPNSRYLIDFYSNPVADPLAEGKTYVGTASLVTNGSGNGSVTSSLAVATGQYITATATDALGNTSEFSAAVQVTATADLLISTGSSDPFTSDNVYQPVPDGAQVKGKLIEPGATTGFAVRVQNDASTTRSYLVKASITRPDGWTLRYSVNGVDITSQILSTGYNTGPLAPGASQTINVSFAANTALRPGDFTDTIVQVFLNGEDQTVRDSVRARATVKATADLLIRTSSSDPFTINNGYFRTPQAGQDKEKTVTPGSSVIYEVKVENDADTTRGFVLKAASSPTTGWTVTYTVGATNITSAITSAAGYATGSLAPGASQSIVVRVAAGSSVAAGTVNNTIVQVHLNSADTIVRDLVRARTRVASGG